jgi:NCAIR mutase (PurE)-related protein
MTDDVRSILERLSSGELSVDDALRELRFAPFIDLGFAKVDHHRELRSGLPEAVYGPGKTPEQAAAIVAELMSRGSGPVLVTRAEPSHFEEIRKRFPEAVFHETSRLIVARPASIEPPGVVLVAGAGTADLPVAEEAADTAEAIGLKVERLHDVGVAGLHRLLASGEALTRADVIIVVAGMDGVLPSIVGGLVSAPVIAVPTSVGYGAGAGGIAPLLTMLNSCAPGIAVVNIDNGYGAAVFARLVLDLK